MEEYKTYTLEELSIGKGSYGIAASAVPFDTSLHTYLRITDINDDGTLNKSGLMSVDEDEAGKYLLKPNDIVFARTGNSTGRSYFYDGSDGELVYAGFLIKFSLDNAKVNPRILKYYTHSKPYYDWIQSFGTGSTRGNINAKTYGNMPITLPPRDIQDKIVDVLKSLDDIIEVNRRINDNFYLACLEVILIWLLTSLENDNLEQQAQALFKSWFVDFEPFKDNEFVESELGMIPKGWRVVSFDEMTSKFGTGLNPRKNFILGEGSNYYVTIKNMSNNRVYLDDKCDKVNDEAIEKINKRSKLQKGDLLFSGIGTIGRVALITETPTNWNTSESVFNLHPSEDVSSEFLYILLLSDVFQQYVKLHAQGGVQQGIRMASLKDYKMAIPEYGIMREFDNKVIPLISLTKRNDDETDRLASLRDTLLPRLMSGELKVEDVTL